MNKKIAHIKKTFPHFLVSNKGSVHAVSPGKSRRPQGAGPLWESRHGRYDIVDNWLFGMTPKRAEEQLQKMARVVLSFYFRFPGEEPILMTRHPAELRNGPLCRKNEFLNHCLTQFWGKIDIRERDGGYIAHWTDCDRWVIIFSGSVTHSRETARLTLAHAIKRACMQYLSPWYDFPKL